MKPDNPISPTTVYVIPKGFEHVKNLFDVRAVTGYTLPVESLIPPTISDPMIRQAYKMQVQPTYENLLWCWENEGMIQKVAKLLHETVAGGGYEFVDRKGKELPEGDLRESFEEVYDVFPMGDFLEVSTENLTIFGNQLWVPRFEVDGEFRGLDPIDWTKVKVYRHPVTGFLMFVLEVTIPVDRDIVEFSPMQTREGKTVSAKITKTISYDDWKGLDPQLMEAKTYGQIQAFFSLFPDETLFLKIGHRGFPVGKSPMAPIVTSIVRKRLLEFYMGRGAEVWGSPILVGKTGVGIPAESLVSLMRRPEDWSNYQKRITDFADMLVKYRQFGTFSLAGDQELKVEFPGRGAMDYVRALDYLDKEIAGCLLASTALFEAKGTELATSRTIKNVWDLAVDGTRRRFEDCLNKQFHPMVWEKNRVGKEKGFIRFRKMEIPEEVLFKILESTRKKVERTKERPKEE